MPVSRPTLPQPAETVTSPSVHRPQRWSARWRWTTALALAALAGLVWWWAVLRERRPVVPLPEQPAWSVRVTTFAGAGTPGSALGHAGEVRFADPFGLAVDRSGNLYVADAGDNNRIVRIDPSGHATLLAGGDEGFRDGVGQAAAFHTPSGLAVGPDNVLYVADTGNHAIRKVTADGVVSTVAGNGQPGRMDGPAALARFDGPMDVAVARDGTVFVADAYNDAVRAIAPDGTVSTLAGGAGTGHRDGDVSAALFDTPCGIALGPGGQLLIADTGNDVVRRIEGDEARTVTTLAGLTPMAGEERARAALSRPIGVAAVETGDVYVTDGYGRVVLFTAHGATRLLAGSTPGFANGQGVDARFNTPTGIVADWRGVVRVADSDNYQVRQLTPPWESVPPRDISLDPVPHLTAETLRLAGLPWPVEPQDRPHELAATFGEARGSVGGDGRERLHSGIDVQARPGAMVRAVRREKVRRPISAVAFGTINEMVRVGVVSYVHVRVGRGWADRLLDASKFSIVSDENGQSRKVRIRRGTWFEAGEAIATVNRFAHVHLEVGPRGAELNPLLFALPGLKDRIAPVILPGGVELTDEAGQALPVVDGRAVVGGKVSIVVEAYDRIDGNKPGRKLGIHSAGYQVLYPDGRPAPGYELPHVTLRFDRHPGTLDGGFLSYADGSGITVYGNTTTRFRYIVTNQVQGGFAAPGWWDTAPWPPGPLVVRVFVSDYAGNTTTRDVPVLVQH